MAYTKDKDRQTRGVGAIASLDHALPNRQALRRRVLEDTKRHDRAMAAVTKGALGTVRDPIVTAVQREVFNRTGSTHVPVPTGARPRPVTPAAHAPKTGVIVTDHRGGSAGGPWAGLRNLNAQLASIVAQPAAPKPPDANPPATSDPAQTTPPTTPATTTTTGSGGGGGGGGGSAGRGPATSGPATSGPAGPAVDPLPSLPDMPVTAEDNTTRNLLIVGGTALAAYLLFIRGRQ